MNHFRSTAGLIGIALLMSVPALAQTPQPTRPPANAPAANARNNPVIFGTVQKAQNSWRGRTLINARVLDDNGRRIATITDLLVTDDGKIDRVVLALPGARRRFVTVPFTQLRFVPSVGALPLAPVPSDAVVNPPVADSSVYGVVLPGATRESLAQAEQFRF